MVKLTKLSWKLAFQYALVFAAVLIALNASVLYGVKFFLIYQAEQKVDSVSRAVEQRIIGPNSEQMTLGDPELINEAKSDNTLNIKVAGPSGKIVNGSANFNTLSVPMIDNINTARKIEGRGLNLVIKNTAVIDGGKVRAYVQVSQNMEKEYTFLKILLILLAIADTFGILFSLFAGYLLSRKMLRPIDKMTKAANAIGLSGLSARIEVPPADDELSRLAKTFNEMLDRIKIVFEKQGRFVADASHELRTPVSIIQGYIGIMDRWGKQDEKVLQESIDAIKKETLSMTIMIKKLLFLARGDNGSQVLQKATFSIDELMEEVSLESSMLASGHHFSFQGSPGLELFADRRMIKQMLRALLNNSIKFTPKGGRVTLLYTGNENNIVFSILDTGIGIPEEEQVQIFERFYRVDKARARETGGSGLGLSIVKWIVDVHEGEISIVSSVENGTSVAVTLPKLLELQL
ncbi:MAG: ATP-binding protein [Desulfosporosinus sp.]|nr:ATP-binding protein [Desulfosporosinus sp.]